MLAETVPLPLALATKVMLQATNEKAAVNEFETSGEGELEAEAVEAAGTGEPPACTTAVAALEVISAKDAEHDGEEDISADHLEFTENVEEMAQIVTSLCRVVFGILGDFRDIADIHYSKVILLAPQSWRKPMESLHPFVKEVAIVVEIVIGILLILLEICAEIAQYIWSRLKPHRPDILISAGVGFAICFFGGFFSLTLSAAEAFGIVGYAQMKTCLHNVQLDLRNAWSVSKKEANPSSEPNPTDVNAVEQPTGTNEEQFALQKLFTIMSAINPDRLLEAVRGISAGCVTVFITLRSKNLQIITLGNAMSVKFESILTPMLDPLVPDHLHKWKPYIFSWGSKLIAIGLAWRLSKVLAAIHSSWRGGFIFSRYALDYCRKFGYISRSLRKEFELDVFLGISMAALGLWFQFSTGLMLPFPFNILFLPFTITEVILTWTLNQTTSVLYHTVASTV